MEFFEDMQATLDKIAKAVNEVMTEEIKEKFVDLKDDVANVFTDTQDFLAHQAKTIEHATSLVVDIVMDILHDGDPAQAETPQSRGIEYLELKAKVLQKL